MPTLDENIAWMRGFKDGLHASEAKFEGRYDEKSWHDAFGKWDPFSGECPPKVSHFITRKDGHGDQQ